MMSLQKGGGGLVMESETIKGGGEGFFQVKLCETFVTFVKVSPINLAMIFT